MSDKHLKTDTAPSVQDGQPASGSADATVVPFPGPRARPRVRRPEQVLRDLDDFDPGPGAA